MKTLTEKITEVQDAITTVLKGQQASWDGKVFTMASLQTLRDYEHDLLVEYKASRGTSQRRNRGVLNRG